MEPLTLELHPGTDIARNWTVITAAYSGLEQTLKYLFAAQKGLTITELIEFAVPESVDADESGDGRTPFRTHNVGWLFSKVEEPTQDIVRDFYERIQSLHSYLATGSVDHFLTLVSGPKGVGYERWRYTLIEDKPLPSDLPPLNVLTQTLMAWAVPPRGMKQGGVDATNEVDGLVAVW